MPQLSKMLQTIPLNPIRFITPLIEAREKEGIFFYKLNIGQPDLEIEPAISEFYSSEKIINHIEYTNSQGIQSLREAWANDYYEGKFTSAGVMITNGSSEGMLFITLALLNEGEANLTFSPIYPNYESFAHMTGRKIISVPRLAKEGYRFPSKNVIEQTIKDNLNIKVITIISPDNPTGYVMTGEEIDMIFSLATQYDLWVVIDEAYRDIRFNKQSTAVSDYISNKKEWMNRSIFLSSTSKEFSACGLRVGALISTNTDLVKEIVKLGMPRLSVNEVAQLSAIKALSLPRTARKNVMEKYKKRRDVVVEIFNELGVDVIKPEGALYFLPDLAPLGITDSIDFAKWMVGKYYWTDSDGTKKSVVVTPGGGFYPSGSNDEGKSLIRIAYVVDEEKLKEAMNILKMGITEFIRVNKRRN